MAITLTQLKAEIQTAEFPYQKRNGATEISWNGIVLYREYKVRRYRSHTGKLIKKSTSSHFANNGRYNQKGARTILISALCRAWLYGFDKKATLNHKTKNQSAFDKFASSIMIREGIGRTHRHLEEYWSIRKNMWSQRKKWRVSGGTF